MTKLYEETRNMIHCIVCAREREADYRLSTIEHDFVVTTLTDFVIAAATKYINGAKEHGTPGEDGENNNFLEIDHLGELKKEIIDSLFYQAGAVNKRNNGLQNLH